MAASTHEPITFEQSAQTVVSCELCGVVNERIYEWMIQALVNDFKISRADALISLYRWYGDSGTVEDVQALNRIFQREVLSGQRGEVNVDLFVYAWRAQGRGNFSIDSGFSGQVDNDGEATVPRAPERRYGPMYPSSRSLPVSSIIAALTERFKGQVAMATNAFPTNEMAKALAHSGREALYWALDVYGSFKIPVYEKNVETIRNALSVYQQNGVQPGRVPVLDTSAATLKVQPGYQFNSHKADIFKAARGTAEDYSKIEAERMAEVYERLKKK